MKTEHPIIFSTDMVQAILQGRKTQTRRIFKDHPRLASDVSKIDLKQWFSDFPDLIMSYCPYGKPGDILWVRESFFEYSKNEYEYKANFTNEPIKWKPSIHMPRKAARIFFEVINIRVEKVQDISIDDCIQEGSPFIKSENYHYQWYKNLWCKINGKASWDKNPWVWVIEFKLKINK